LFDEKNATMDGPRALADRYTRALEGFGKLLDVYRSKSTPLYVQTRNILDSTGSFAPAGRRRASRRHHGDGAQRDQSHRRSGVYVPFQPEYVPANAQLRGTVHVTLLD
jgi:hypothetical protein